MKIQSKWRSRATRDRLARTAAIDTAEQLAHQPAIGHRGVALISARRPPWLFCSQRGGHDIPVVQCFCGQRPAYRRQTRPVAEQLTQGDGGLAIGGELRPYACDGFVQFQLALSDKLQRSDCSERLGTGKQVDQRIAVPDLLALVVGNARP